MCLCQFDMKEKRSFFGQRKDYWDFLCQGLARSRQEHEGVRFVTSLDKVGTGWWVPGGSCLHTCAHLRVFVGAHTLCMGTHLPRHRGFDHWHYKGLSLLWDPYCPPALALGTPFPLQGLGGRHVGGRLVW